MEGKPKQEFIFDYVAS